MGRDQLEGRPALDIECSDIFLPFLLGKIKDLAVRSIDRGHTDTKTCISEDSNLSENKRVRDSRILADQVTDR